MSLVQLADVASRDRRNDHTPLSEDFRLTPSVRIRNLCKSFPTRRSIAQLATRPFARQRMTVIQGINLDIYEGELFGILGLNGAGKTTLLKMLATLLIPDGGGADVGGHDICDDPQAVREGVAMVPADERSLNWRLSGLENLRLFAGLHRLSRKEASTRIASALAAVGLLDVGNKLVGAYSSGMRQRLILARALLAAPRVLLMDEPTRSLDPVTAHAFRRMLRDDIVNHAGTTVVLATHNAEEAFTYCDRVAVLHHGRLAALGTGVELAERFGRNRYRIWTSTPHHSVFDELVRRNLLTTVVRRSDADDGEGVECIVAGNEEVAAEVLRSLVEAGVSVTRFERATMPLSSLIAQIAATHDLERGAAHA